MVRRMLAACDVGLAKAARQAGCTSPDQEAQVVFAMSEIVYSMAASGRGDEVLRMYAQLASRTPEGKKTEQGTPLERAFQRLPGLGRVTDKSLPADARNETPAETDTCTARATDYQSGGQGQDAPELPDPRGLGPRQGTLLDGLTGRPLGSPRERADEPAARAPAAGAPGYPYPPSGLPPHIYPVGAENLENSDSEDPEEPCA